MLSFFCSVSESCFDQEKMQRETEEKLETEAINMIIERLIDNKPSLYWHYTREVGRLIRRIKSTGCDA